MLCYHIGAIILYIGYLAYALYDIAVELDSREFSNNCIVDRLIGLSWDELCDKGIEILTKLKERWEEDNDAGAEDTESR